jgi:hypothetical protein
MAVGRGTSRRNARISGGILGNFSLLEAAERSLDFGVGCKFPAFGLRQPFQDGGKMGWIDRFWFCVIPGGMRHGDSFVSGLANLAGAGSGKPNC